MLPQDGRLEGRERSRSIAIESWMTKGKCALRCRHVAAPTI